MDDLPVNKKVKPQLVKTIITGGLNSDDLKNEVFCQLIKQTTNNPKPDSNLKVSACACLYVCACVCVRVFCQYLL